MDLRHRITVASLLFIVLLSSPHLVESQQLSISTHDVLLIIPEHKEYIIQVNGDLDKDVNVTLEVTHEGMVGLVPRTIQLNSKQPNATGTIIGVKPGHLEITASVSPDTVDVKNIYIRVLVALSSELITISSVIGWIYFAAWSISFYPQIYINYKRKSVVGLNFDFLALNIVGFVLYGTFNIGLYSIPEIRAEYSNRFPRGVNPVQLNDIFFAFHAVFATLITIGQCFVYERADQRVSTIGRSFLALFAFCGGLAAALAIFKVIHWLDFLYICSYIKLTITLIKYVPQAYMNYQRKSTIGWSIGNVLLDFTGGVLSMLQMILNAYNYDDFISLFGDPTKFGLGLFSVMFDILFVLQHYVFYRHPESYIEIAGDNIETTQEQVNENEEN